MKALKFNADYEMELFQNKKGPAIINQSLEFLIFFLTDQSLYSSKKYDADYLRYVEELTGRSPQTVSTGEYENWWGPLKNLESERWWNSKITSTELGITQGWLKDVEIIQQAHDVPTQEYTQSMLLKDPFSMSGQRIQKVTGKIPQPSIFPLILEPSLERIYDFSQYVFPDGKSIFYQNVVDEKFHYKGTIINGTLTLESMSFYSEISQAEWEEFKCIINQIKQFYGQYPNEVGYSIDSFIYRLNGEFKIYPMCEINYRKTMGRVAFQLAQKYSDSDWNQLLLLKPGAIPLWKKFKNNSDLLVLSPGDTRFEVVLVKNKDALKSLSET